MSAPFEPVGLVGDIPEGGRLACIVDDRAVLVLHVGGEYFAIEDVCTHDGQPLTNGPINGCEITCPRHGARFDVRTGKALCMPATSPVPRLEVRIVGDQILVGPELPPA